MASRDSPSGRRREFSRTLKRRGVELAIISNPRHIYYFTGFPSNMHMFSTLTKGHRSTSFLLLGGDGESALLLGRGEAPGSSPTIPGFDGSVSTYPDYQLDLRMVTYAPDLSSEMAGWLRSYRQGRKGKVGVEDWHLAGIYREVIGKAFPQSSLVGVSDTILRMRLVKGEDEISKLKWATRMIDFAFGIAKEHVRAGKSEIDLFKEMNYATLDKYGPFGWVTGEVVSGERSLEIGGQPTTKKMKDGDLVILDLQVAHDHYWSDLCRTFVVGRANAKQKRLHDVLVKTKAVAASMLTPGTVAGNIHAAVNEMLVDNGYPKMVHHTGHGIGLDNHEGPWILPNSKDRIQEGNVFVVEPGVYTAQAGGGQRVEDCYVVRKNGPEKISHFPLGL